MLSIAIIATALSISTSTQAPNPCLAPEPTDPASVKKCFATACDDYQAAWYACQTEACRTAAYGNHILAIADCVASQRQHNTGSASWITLWYADERWGYSYDGSMPSNARASFSF